VSSVSGSVKSTTAATLLVERQQHKQAIHATTYTNDKSMKPFDEGEDR
jgi:hypothetical protein